MSYQLQNQSNSVQRRDVYVNSLEEFESTLRGLQKGA